MSEFIDQVGRKVILEKVPLRIVSTVPSQTELLYDLGLEENVVGITAYCVHPPHWLKEKTVIGGTKDLQLQKIAALKPDLIIGNKEENVKEQIEALAENHPVWLSDITTVDQALEMIKSVGEICGKAEKAAKIIEEIEGCRAELSVKKEKKRAAYFIWKDPFMLAGPDTFINSMLMECGLQNVVEPLTPRYPQITLPDLKKLNPEVILLSSEPYSFNTTDLHQLAYYFPNAELRIVDGEIFSWYGSRMKYSFIYFYKTF